MMSYLLDLEINNEKYDFSSNITNELALTENELSELEERICESQTIIRKLTPECDKTDYILAASSGALCGIIDAFLIGKPGESPVGEITDKWFEDRTKDFAKLCGWKNDGSNELASAIRYLEKKFPVPYDQQGTTSLSNAIFKLDPSNHHFKSLGHNPTLLGLFFSILDQFSRKSHFVARGELVWIAEDNGRFELQGNSIPAKLFCGFVNWIGHLISDVSGSSGSFGRGMGIPSPLWSWSNDVIALKRSLHINSSKFDEKVNELAIEIFKKGFDARFQTAQIIPVFINEMVVRLLYSIRRLLQFLDNRAESELSVDEMWKNCNPFGNSTVKRMLTVAHGTFCLVDAGDALIHSIVAGGGAVNVTELFLRINIAGFGRFTVSLYGEAKFAYEKNKESNNLYIFSREKAILNYYLEGLKELSNLYDDKELLTFVDDFKNSKPYVEAFQKSVLLAEKRNVPEEKILRTKKDIDEYFLGGKE